VRRAACLAAVCLWGAGLTALPSQAQEQVRVQVPDSVIFEILDLEGPAIAAVSRLSFDHVLLAPGNCLRISGPLRPGDYTTVFESSPLALAGSVDLSWTLEPAGRFDRSGARAVTLRWKVESIPGAAPRMGGGRPIERELPSGAVSEAGSDPRGREGPGRGVTPRPPF
jgi:hypothetical protein